MARFVRVCAFGGTLALALPVYATQPQLACPDVLLRSSHPATAEWAAWVTGGRVVGRDSSDASRPSSAWLFGVGAETTFQAFTYRGFPGLTHWSYPDGEVRWGPWLTAGYRAPGTIGEGGLKVHVGAVRSQAFGTFELRFGLGYGQLNEGATPLYTSSAGWGIRTVVGRQHARGACDPLPVARTAAEASNFRFLFTHRASLVDARATEWVLSLELSPTFFLPPVVCEHFSVN